jgi:hypothetical protein
METNSNRPIWAQTDMYHRREDSMARIDQGNNISPQWDHARLNAHHGRILQIQRHAKPHRSFEWPTEELQDKQPTVVLYYLIGCTECDTPVGLKV